MKKLLCLVLSVVMAFSCFSMCLTASAADYLYRPEEVARVIDPILIGADSIFSKGINEISFETSKNKISKSEFANRIKGYSNPGNYFPESDRMFGINLDFLYNNDNSEFLWDYLKYELTANTNIHNEEIKSAEANKTKSTCQMKGWYDTCSEILYGYEYDYPSKAIDKQIFEGIIEMKSTIFNNSTRKNEAHYKYYYFFDEGQFSLMRSNTNYIIKKAIDGSIANGKLYATKEIANANAIKLSNFIGNLLYADFDNIAPDAVIIDNNVSMTDEAFFRVVTEYSKLDDVLQNGWVKAIKFDVKDIMSALGVSVKDNVILDVELQKGTYMGARILTDMYRGFVDSPVGYIANLFQLFCRNYEGLYKEAIKALFALRFDDFVARSRQSGDAVESYNGDELSNVNGFVQFLADNIYFAEIDNATNTKEWYVDEIDKVTKDAKKDGKIDEKEQAKINALKYELSIVERKLTAKKALKLDFAPLPIVRFANAKNMNELYLYLLCYFNINKSYGVNPNKATYTDYRVDKATNTVINKTHTFNIIEEFIYSIEVFLNNEYVVEVKSDETSDENTVNAADVKSGDISNVKKVLTDMLNGTFVFTEIKAFYLGMVVQDVITSFPDNFMSKIKNSIANLINNFIRAMDNFMNLLFGWTEGLFDKNK